MDKNQVDGPVFAAFSEAEHRARLARAREELGAAGFDGCIVIAPENLFYLAGYDSIASYISRQALVFSVHDDRDPTLIVRNLDLPLVAETSWIGDIRTYHLNSDDVCEAISAVVLEHGVASGKIGLELQSYAVTGAFAIELMRSVPGAQIQDSSVMLNKLQYVKSRAEIEYIREAAGYANRGIEAAQKALRPGMSEIALCAAVEAAVRGAGSDYPAIPTECASGIRSPGGHATAMPKPIMTGDLVHLEFAGVARRYHCVSMVTMAAGAPSGEGQALYDLGRESLEAGLECCGPGALVADIDRASLRPVEKAGLGHAAQMRFGCGIGIAYPPVWVGSLQVDRFSEGILEPGMVFYVHSWLSLPDQYLGVMLGGTYMVTRDGIEALTGAGPQDLYVA